MSQFLPDDVSTMTAFVVLAALAKQPMNVPELGRTLLLSPPVVRSRLAELEKLGWVVKRWQDGRFVVRVLLAPMAVPEPGEPRKPGNYPVLGHQFIRSVDPPDESKTSGGVEGQEVPQEPVEWRTATEKLARSWGLPVRLKGLHGEINVGRLDGCSKCGISTPLKYGDVPVCPKCGRAWGKDTVNGQ